MNGFQLGDFLCAVLVSFALFTVIRLVLKTMNEPDHKPRSEPRKTARTRRERLSKLQHMELPALGQVRRKPKSYANHIQGG
jgi:hypothetical protein